MSIVKSVQYVKICSLYGAGFYYMPGTDTCIKIGGFVRTEVNFNAGGSFGVAFNDRDIRTYNVQHWRSRAAITADARSQTAYGTLRAYAYIAATDDSGLNSGSNIGKGGAPSGLAYNRIYAPAMFIQFAGFTAGKTASFFDFDSMGYSNQSNVWGSAQGGNGINLWAYTAQFGNGLSASISAESNLGHRLGISTIAGAASTTFGGESIPDLVGNLRVDQAWGSAQIMGAYHQVNFGEQTAPSDKGGWAFGAGAKVNLPMLGKGDYIIGQFTYGVGATTYVGSGLANAQTVKQAGVTSYGPAFDAVLTGTGTTADLTTGWSITGGLEHNWVPGWKTSLYGAYGKLQYSAAASAILIGGVTATGGAVAGTSANWSFWQIGSRTVWTPVTNLDLSVELMYNAQQTAFTGPNIGNNSWWSGMFRAQRNFYP